MENQGASTVRSIIFNNKPRQAFHGAGKVCCTLLKIGGLTYGNEESELFSNTHAKYRPAAVGGSR